MTSDRTQLVDDLIDAATAVRDGDGSAADRLVTLARQVRLLDDGRGDHSYPTRLDLADLAPIAPGALYDSQARRRAEVYDLLFEVTAIAATGGDVREVFETASVPVRDRLAMECLALIGDLDRDDVVVLYAGTKGGQATSLISAVRDRFEVAAVRERALDRLVHGHRYPWEH